MMRRSNPIALARDRVQLVDRCEDELAIID
jgi:hypothetical protein